MPFQELALFGLHDHRQLARLRPAGAAAHRRIDHGDALGLQLLGESACGEGIDGRHADHDVACLGSPDDAALARDHLLRLIGGLDDQAVPDRRGLAQGGFQALQDLDDVVVRQTRQVVTEQAVDRAVESGQPRLDRGPTRFESMFEP